MSTSSPTDLDRDLERLRIAVGRIDTNLLELEQHPTKALLESAPLRDTTAARWAEASATLAELFHWSVLLHRSAEQAIEVRGTRRAVDPARAQELVAVLYGPSIELSDTTVPFEARALLGSARTVERCTPDELIQRMERAYDGVKQLLLAADGMWEDGVARIAAARTSGLELADRAGQLGGGLPTQLADVQATIDALADDVLSDPLAVDPEQFDDIEATLDTTRLRVEEAEALRADVEGRVAAARSLLSELDAAVEAGQAARAETVAKIARADVVDPVTADHGSSRALERAMAIATGGDWAAGAAALAVWQQDTAALLARAREVARRNRAALHERNELRGRLDVFRAKTAGLGLLEDAEIQACFDEATRALYTAPTDLVRAADLVRRYQVALRARRGRPER